VRNAINTAYDNINLTVEKYTVPVTAHVYGKRKIIKALYDKFVANDDNDLAALIKKRYGFE
jgi:hypothetical protein